MGESQPARSDLAVQQDTILLFKKKQSLDLSSVYSDEIPN